ncbi:hypothetical protein G3I19_35490, partial [Streptomyces sp. SID10853]|nr:hypothetical protein [Streptomyces sp. SID10853]
SLAAHPSAPAHAAHPTEPARAPHPPAVRHQRSWTPGNDEDTGQAPDPAPSSTASGTKDMEAAARRSTQQAVPRDSALALHVGALGAGLALVGLGLGFLGLRLRRP